jgi:hypothetical protein
MFQPSHLSQNVGQIEASALVPAVHANDPGLAPDVGQVKICLCCLRRLVAFILIFVRRIERYTAGLC